MTTYRIELTPGHAFGPVFTSEEAAHDHALQTLAHGTEWRLLTMPARAGSAGVRDLVVYKPDCS